MDIALAGEHECLMPLSLLKQRSITRSLFKTLSNFLAKQPDDSEQLLGS